MGDIQLPTAGAPWTSLSPPRIPTLAQLETDINGAELTAAAKADLSLGWTNVKAAAYGATGDGSTDDYAAIQAAIDAAELVGYGTVFLPPGVYVLSQGLTIQSNGVHLVGSGVGSTILTHKVGIAAISYLIDVVNAAGTDSLINVSLRDFSITGDRDGHLSGTSDAAIRWAGYASSISDIYILQCSGKGLIVDDPGTAEVGECVYNTYTNILARFCDKGGFKIIDETTARWTACMARACGETSSGVQRPTVGATAYGFEITNKDKSGTLAENTGSTYVGCIAEHSGSHGWRINGIARSTFAGCCSLSNVFGAGIHFSTAPESNGGTSQLTTFSGWHMRNNSLGSIQMDAGAILNDLLFDGFTVDAGATTVVEHAEIELDGSGAGQVSRVTISNWRGRGGVSTLVKLTECIDVIISDFAHHDVANTGTASEECHGIYLVTAGSATQNIALSNIKLQGTQFSAAAGGYGIKVVGGTDVTLTGYYHFLGTDDRAFDVTAGAEKEFAVQCQVTENGAINTPATVASATTITLPPFGKLVSVTGTADIDTITASFPEDQRILKFAGTAATNGVVDASNLKLASTFAYTPDDTLAIVCDGTNWYEMSRSAN